MAETDPIQEFFRERLVLSETSIEAASRSWKDDNKAIIRGAEEGNCEPSELLHEFKAMSRLRYDSELLMAHSTRLGDGLGISSQKSRKKIIYAIDPHILLGYADIGKSTKKDFDYISNEWEDQDERSRYLIYLYTAIAKSGPFCILEPGRQQLLGYYAYFREEMWRSEHQEKEYFDKRLERFELLTKNFEIVSSESSNSNSIGRVSQPRDVLSQKFKMLINAVAAGGIYADLALTRLNDFMRIGNFQNVYNVLQKHQEIDPEKRREFFDILHKLEDENELQNLSKVYLKGAFGQFIDSGQQVAKPFHKSFDEFLNLEAVREIHTYNCIFDYLDVKLEFRYLSNSSVLFAFLSKFQQEINCPLVHARTFFAYRNKSFFKEISRPITKMLAHSSAAASVIRTDGVISKKELEKFREFGASLTALRDANAFAGVETDAANKFIESVNVSIQSSVVKLREHPEVQSDKNRMTRIEDIERRLASIRSYLGDQLETDQKQVPSLLDRVIQKEDESDHLYNIFKELAWTGEAKKHPLIAVRSVFAEEGKSVRRLMCLPVRGGYRYAFAVCGSDVLNAEFLAKNGISKDFCVFDINKLVDVVNSILLGDHSQVNSPEKVKAVQGFIRSVHAASYRDWNFALFLAQSSLGNLKRVDAKFQNENYYFLKSEIHYLIHLSKRGLAEQKYKGKRHVVELRGAFESLKESAKSLAEAYRLEDKSMSLGSSPVSPEMDEFAGALSFRVPLAYIGTCLELLVSQKNLGAYHSADIMNLRDEPVFSDIGNKSATKFYWQIDSIDTLDLRGLWDDPRAFSIKLNKCLFELLELASGKVSSGDDLSNRDIIDPDLWNYRMLRCYQMIFTQFQLMKTGFTYGGLKDEDLDPHLDDYAKAIDRYDDFLVEMANENFKSEARENYGDFSSESASPFSSILYWATSLDANASTAEKFDRYASILNHERRLDPLGLPRAMSREIRKQICIQIDGQKPLWEELILRANELRREFE